MTPEASYLLARCQLILNAIEAADPGSFIVELRQALEATAAKGDVRGLRSIRRDLLEMSQILGSNERAAVDAALTVHEVDDPSL